MKSISESMKEFKTNEKNNKDVDVDKVIKALVDAKPSSDNAEQGKFVQLMRGLSFSDDPKATNFMKKLMGAIDNSFISDNVSEGVSGAEIIAIMKKANTSAILDMMADEEKNREVSNELSKCSDKISSME